LPSEIAGFSVDDCKAAATVIAFAGVVGGGDALGVGVDCGGGGLIVASALEFPLSWIILSSPASCNSRNLE